MTTRDPTAVEQLAGFVEALRDLRPTPNETSFAFERGEDIPNADAEVLRRIMTLRDVLLGIRDYLRVCGGNGHVPGLLIWRGDLAQQELERRMEIPPVSAPSQDSPAPTAKAKEPVKRRVRGKV